VVFSSHFLLYSLTSPRSPKTLNTAHVVGGDARLARSGLFHSDTLKEITGYERPVYLRTGILRYIIVLHCTHTQVHTGRYTIANPPPPPTTLMCIILCTYVGIHTQTKYYIIYYTWALSYTVICTIGGGRVYYFYYR